MVREKIPLTRGDLKDPNGRILKQEGGRAPGIFVNGGEVSLNKVLTRGDRVTVRRGLDIIEQVERRVETIAPATYVTGQGALLTVGSSGYPGMKIVNVGTHSGRVISEQVIRPVKPVVLQREIHTQNQVVALTFDDGPSPTFTPQILSILRAEQVPATFFVIGSQARKYSSLVAEILGSGSAVGNHTFSHSLVGDISMVDVETEIAKGEAAIEKACGVGSYWFRPPGGSMSASIVEAAAIQGCKTILWTIDPLDWMQPTPKQICQRILNEVHPGAVILLHDGGGDRTATVQALPEIITQLRGKGYSPLSSWTRSWEMNSPFLCNKHINRNIMGSESRDCGYCLQFKGQTDGSCMSVSPQKTVIVAPAIPQSITVQVKGTSWGYDQVDSF